MPLSYNTRTALMAHVLLSRTPTYPVGHGPLSASSSPIIKPGSLSPRAQEPNVQATQVPLGPVWCYTAVANESMSPFSPLGAAAAALIALLPTKPTLAGSRYAVLIVCSISSRCSIDRMAKSSHNFMLLLSEPPIAVSILRDVACCLGVARCPDVARCPGAAAAAIAS